MPSQFSLTFSVSAYKKHGAIKTRVLQWRRLDDILMGRDSGHPDFRGALLLGRVIAYMGNFHLTNFTVFQRIPDKSVCAPCTEAGGLESPLHLASSHLALSACVVLISQEGRASMRKRGQDCKHHPQAASHPFRQAGWGKLIM